MRNRFPCKYLVAMLLAIGSAGVMAQPTTDAASTVAIPNLPAGTSPQDHYRLLKREAHAAYNQAVRDCRQMNARDRASCMKEAKSHLQNDLARARESFIAARQMTPDPEPEAQVKRARREAYAAYEETLQNCNDMSGNERNACKQSAKSQLQNDLAYVKSQFGSETSVGASGAEGRAKTGGSTGSGTDVGGTSR